MKAHTGKVHSFFHLRDADKPKAQELLIDIDVLSYLIRLQLNPKESPDDRIQSTLTSISNTAATTTFDDLQRDLETLTALTQDLLKNEWEKVKREAEERTVMKPQGGAIGRQPSGPDTTRTSATVASSRSP